jgi:hypothetical protein
MTDLNAIAAELERLEKEVPPGPWLAGAVPLSDGGPPAYRLFNEADSSHEATVCESWSGECNTKAVVELIAVMRNNLAALLAERKRLREALTKCEEQFSLYAREHRRKERASRFNGISFFADESARKAITNEESAAMAREVLGGKP